MRRIVILLLRGRIVILLLRRWIVILLLRVRLLLLRIGLLRRITIAVLILLGAGTWRRWWRRVVAGVVIAWIVGVAVWVPVIRIAAPAT